MLPPRTGLLAFAVAGFLGLTAGAAISLSSIGQAQADRSSDPAPKMEAKANPLAAEPQQSASTSGENGKILRRGNVAEPDTLDPQKYGLSYESEIMRDLFVGLVGIDAKAHLIPGAAESWKISDDGRVYTLKMRKGHLWSDGTPVTAQDAVFGIRRALDPKTNAQFANLAYKIENAFQVNTQGLDPQQLGVRALDDETVEITLDRPSPVLLNLLSIPLLFPVPVHAIKKYGDGWVKPGQMVSNGAFTLEEWRPNNYIRVKKNPHFYDAANVALEQIYYFPIESDNTAIKKFRAGEIDFNARFVHQDAQWLRQNMPAAMRMTTASWVTYLVVNQKLDKFKDPRVRKAMSMLIDRESICQRILGLGEVPAYGIVPPVVTGYQGAELDFRNLDLETRQQQARALLAEAGYGPGNPLTFEMRYRTGTTNKMVAVAIQQAWGRANIRAQLAVSEVKVHYNDLREKNFEVADAGWIGPIDPEYFIYLVRTDSTETNYGSYSNAEYDRLAREGEGMIDLPQRYATFAAAEKIALDETAIIPILFNVNRNLVSPRLTGFENNAQDIHPSRFMRLDVTTQ